MLQLCAGIASVGLELVFQGAEIALGMRTELDGRELGVAFATGAAGVGFVKHARRAGVFAEMAVDAVVSTADKIGDGEEINGEMAMSVALDVVAGRVTDGLGRGAGRSHRDAIQELGDPGSDFRRRFPTRRQRMRRDMANERGEAEGEAVDILVGATAAETGSRVVEGGVCLATGGDGNLGEAACPD